MSHVNRREAISGTIALLADAAAPKRSVMEKAHETSIEAWSMTSSDVDITIELAKQEADRLGNDWIGEEHVLVGLLKRAGGVPQVVLTILGISQKLALHMARHRCVESEPLEGAVNYIVTPRVDAAMMRAMSLAKQRDGVISTGDVIMGFASDSGSATSELLKFCQSDYEKLAVAVGVATAFAKHLPKTRFIRLPIPRWILLETCEVDGGKQLVSRHQEMRTALSFDK